MIALLPFAGCKPLDDDSENPENNTENPEEQGEEQGEEPGGGGNQSGDTFVYEVAATQPSGAVKEYTKDLWIDRAQGAGNFQWMVTKTKVAYDSKGRPAKEEIAVTYYAEGGGQDGDVVRSARYYVYDDKARKMEIRKYADRPNTAFFRGDLDADGKLVRSEAGYFNNSSWFTALVTVYEYTDGGLLSRVSCPDESNLYPYEFSWDTSTNNISSIRELDPRAMDDPEEDESRFYHYYREPNPSFGAPFDIASFAVYGRVTGSDYLLPIGKGTMDLVKYANTTYRNEAETFTYEWNEEKTRLEHIKLVQRLFPEDAGVKNERWINYWPEYY